MAFESVALNESIPSPYLDKYEPTKGKKDYAFICTPQKWRTDIHYSEAMKTSFHCFDGLCCKVVPKKTPTTVYLIAQYLDYKDPKSGLVLKFLKAGRQLDEQIRAIVDQFEDPSQITKIDLTLQLDTSKAEKFKMISVTPCVGGKRKACKEALLDLKEQIKAFLPNLQQSVATVMDEVQFRALCEQHNVDLSEFEDEEVESAKKKVAKKVVQEEVEEPEEIEEDDESLEDDTEETVEEDEDEEVEEPTPKASKSKTPTKRAKEDIEETDFDIDDLL